MQAVHVMSGISTMHDFNDWTLFLSSWDLNSHKCPKLPFTRPLLTSKLWFTITDIPSASHWGQRWSYLTGTLWVCCEFLNNSPSCYPPKYPLSTFWTNPLGTFWKNPPNYPAGIFWMNPLSSFTILLSMCPPWTWATHWEFFQNVPINVTNMYLMGSF